MPHDDITELLGEAQENPQAITDLANAVYAEMQEIAARLMCRERADHTWDRTDLVNETLIRLLSGEVIASAPNRRYFYAAACRAMQRLLIDHERRRKTEKRGGGARQCSPDLLDVIATPVDLQFSELEDSLNTLKAKRPRQYEVV